MSQECMLNWIIYLEGIKIIRPFKKPLEEVIRKLAKDNGIKKFNLVTYASFEADSDTLSPEEIRPYELIPVPTTYLLTHSLSDTIKQYSFKQHCDPYNVFGIASIVWVHEGNRTVRREIVQLDIDAQWPDTRAPQMTDEDVPFDVAKRASKLCNQPGYLVHSSTFEGFLQNFHFYGKKLVTHEEWEKLMKEAMHGFVDHSWCQYNLSRGYSVLRVSANKVKPQQPVPVLQT